MSRLLSLLLCVLAAGSGFSGLIISKGEPAPQFSIFNLKGKRFNLADYKGKKAVFINIFSITCEPCKEELPYIIKLHSKYKENVEFVAVDITDPKKVDVENFVKTSGIPYAVCWDTISKTFYSRYIKGGFNMPTSIFIGIDGNISLIMGVLKEEELDKILGGLLGNDKKRAN